MTTRIVQRHIIRNITLEMKTCPGCHKKFEGVKQKRFCSRRCQSQTQYQTHAEATKAKRRGRYKETGK